MCAVVVVIYSVRKLVTLIQLFMIMSYKRSMNPITNLNPVYSH
jgi:hypothetical protein